MENEKLYSKTGVLTSGESISYWLDSVNPLAFTTLKGNVTTDVLVVGGGIAGLTSAYCLLKAGFKVVLVEDGLLGSGETGRTTAHLTCALDDRYYELEKIFGEEGSRKAAQSHAAAIDWIEQVVKEENINCDFERIDGHLFIHSTDTKENLKKEWEALQRTGLKTEWLENVPALAAETGPCIRFLNQGQFHILRYLNGLAQAITKLGGEIFTNTHATKITKKGAQCNGFTVGAQHIVVATNTPVNDLVAIHTKQFPYRTYVIGAKIKKGQLPHALWWDTGDQESKWVTMPYHYVRLANFDEENDILISGGEDHKTGQADDENIPEEERYTPLLEWTKKRFPMMGDVVYKWSGQVMEPVDHLAFIGKNPGDDNVYIITGDSGNGMTHGTLGGLIVTDLIQKKENPWAELYSPKRMPLKVLDTYLSEVFNMAKQYGDFIKKADIKEVDELAANEGAVLSKGLGRFAIYKDEKGVVHSFSAVCPHLGCVLQWNAEEKTFDCPCHGSRFTCLGKVINGPALSDLKRVEVKESSQ